MNIRPHSAQSKKLFFIIKVIVYALKIIGLAPFTVPIKVSSQINPRNTRIQDFQSSRIGLAYNILFVFPLLIAIAIKFHLPHLFSPIDWNETSKLGAKPAIHTAEKIILTLTACIVIISWAWKQKNAASIMNKLLEIDGQLSLLKQQSSKKRSFILLAIHAILNATLWITFWVRRIVYFDLNSLLTTFIFKIPEYIIYWFIVEYFIIVGFLARYLQNVNNYLLSFNEFGNYLFRPRVRDGSLTLPATVASVNIDHTSQLSSLQLLHSVRTKLFELCIEIPEFFSLPILFCISCCFIPLVREMYLIATFNHENIDVTLASTVSYGILIILLYVYPVVSLAINVTRTTKEARLTGHMVHKLLSAPLGREIEKELTQLSLHLLHEDITFTAYGFFTLDSRMLLSIMGAVTSYFVALTQFKSAGCTYSEPPINSTLL